MYSFLLDTNDKAESSDYNYIRDLFNAVMNGGN